MNNFLRKAAGLLVFAAACFGAVHGSDAIGDAVRADRTAAEWVDGLGFTLGTPDACQAKAFEAVKASLAARDAWQGEWVWVTDMADERGSWGLANSGSQTVALDTSIDCARLPSVVAHELTHLWVSDETDGEELVADCVAARVRAVLAPESVQHTPYLDEQGGCTPEASREALALMASHGLA